MDESNIILEIFSPYENVVALVEQSERVVYFYLWGGEGGHYGMRACWVRNLVAAPAESIGPTADEGAPPMLELSRCRHPQGLPSLVKDILRVVWFEAGDGAALFEGNDILAIIPPWSGANDFHGYARDCSAESTLCWPMPASVEIFDRIKSAEQFWTVWAGADNPWKEIREAQLAAYERILGAQNQYFALDGKRWPPRGAAAFELADNASNMKPATTVLASVGVSIRPQPTVERYTENARDLRRIELAIAVENPADAGALAELLATVSAMPWRQFVWLGSGHTLRAGSLPKSIGDRFTSLLFHAQPGGAPRIHLPVERGDPVNLLWLIPITEAERELAESESSEVLVRRLFNGDVGFVHRRNRESVA